MNRDSRETVFYQLSLKYNWLEHKKEKMDFLTELEQIILPKLSIEKIVLIQKVFPGKNGPQLFLSSGDQDQYGFYYGANVFVKYATVNGFQTIWKPVVLGQHCSVDTDALAAFLL